MRNRTPNWALLAGLRFALALVVVFAHVDYFQPNGTPLEFVKEFNASAAVYAFLLVSGFSIRHSVTERPDGFLQRRFWRIYPTYLACFVLALFPYCLTGGVLAGNTLTDAADNSITGLSLIQLLGGFFLLGGLVVPVVPVMVQAWTLAVECLYYLLAPLLVKLNERIIYAIIAASFALQVSLSFFSPSLFADTVGLRAPVCLAWFWLLGWWIASKPLKHTALVYILPVAAVLVDPQMGGKFGALTVAVTAGVLLSQSEICIPRKLHPALCIAGDASYPLYLAHLPVFWIMWVAFGISDALALIALSIAVSLLLWRFIDKPLRKGIISLLCDRKANHNKEKRRDLLEPESTYLRAGSAEGAKV